MKSLFLLVSFLIIYGSVYPFTLDLKPPSPAELDRFLGTLHWTGSRGDILGNVVLFVPYGFLGAFLTGKGWKLAAWFVWFTVWTAFLAFGIQVLQLYMPDRDAALNDGLWNLLGTAIGLLPGLAIARLFIARGGDVNRAVGMLISFPVVMAMCWVGYRLAPYVPSIDLQLWKDSLKPLLLSPTLSGSSTLRSAAGWLAFAALWRGWRGARFGDWPVIPMIALVMFGEVLVVKNVVTLSNVVGAGAAVVLWWTVKRWRIGYAVAAVVVAASIAYSGLEPFTFGAQATHFNLVPFKGFLSGSMYVNVQSLFLKLYLYGSLIWLMVRAGMGYALSFGLVALGVGGIEFAQTRLPNKVPEVTDPLLVVAVGLALRMLERTGGAPAGSAKRTQQDAAAAARAIQREAQRKLEEARLVRRPDDAQPVRRKRRPRPPAAAQAGQVQVIAAPAPSDPAPAPPAAPIPKRPATAAATEKAKRPASADDAVPEKKPARARRAPPAATPRRFLRDRNGPNKGPKSFLR